MRKSVGPGGEKRWQAASEEEEVKKSRGGKKGGRKGRGEGDLRHGPLGARENRRERRGEHGTDRSVTKRARKIA